MSKTLVVGANGNIGQTLVELLRGKGQKVVRATSRAATEPDQVHLNLATGAGLETAFQGATEAFLMAPPGYADPAALLRPAIDAAKGVNLQKVVLLSALGVDADPSIPLRRAELYLEASGVSFAVIRPNWFMQNFHTFWLPVIQHTGAIQLPTGEAKGSFIDTRDIAAVAAELLSNQIAKTGAFDLTGSQSLDHNKVAAIISKEAGKQIGYKDISEDEMRQGLVGAGLPADYANYLLGILAAFKAGYASRVTDTVPQILGRPPITFQQYARDFRSAWI